MRGFPKHINSKADVDFLAKEYPAEIKVKLQDFLFSRFIPVPKITEAVTDIGDKEVVSTIEGEKIQKDFKAETKFTEEKLPIEDINSKLFQLGLSVKEVEGMINE